MAENILVLGSSNVDLILRVPRFPRAGETVIGGNLVTAFGGKGANQAMAAKRLGGKVRFLTKLGNDFFGHSYRRYLTQNGLESRWLLSDKKLPNGIALIELIPGGENRIIVSPGANGALSVGDLHELSAIWRGVRVFVTQLETPWPTVNAALRMARKGEAITLLNPSPFRTLPPEILPLVDFLVPNEGEAQSMAGIRMKRKVDLPRIADRLLSLGIKNVAITLGPRGVYFRNRKEEIWMGAFPVKAVDTTAAGDAFMGALACGLAEGKSIREALRLASAAGALAASKFGAQPSLPLRRELEDFLAHQKKYFHRGERRDRRGKDK